MRITLHTTLTILLVTIFSLTAHAGPVCDPALLKRAESGDVNVQSLVAHIYAAGREGDPDYHKARYWYGRIIAEKTGDAKLIGHANIGLLYISGKGGEKNYSHAMDCFKKAAGQGYYDAHVSIGKLYLEGLGVEQDYVKAKRWIEIAANHGHSKAKRLNYLLERELKREVVEKSLRTSWQKVVVSSLSINYVWLK